MKYIFIILGFICFVLGAVGAFLPMLPATPFLLASAFLFARSSDKMSCWLKGTKAYNNYIKGISDKKGLTKTAKVHTMCTLTVFFLIAAFFMRNTTLGLTIIAIVWISHIIAFTCFVKTKETD